MKKEQEISREKSIAALIRKFRTALDALKNDYQSSLRAKSVSEELKIDIKNNPENLCSCLDYIARGIHDKFVNGSPPRLYFPLRPAFTEFEKVIARDFNGLDQTSSDVYNILKAFSHITTIG